MDHDERVDRLRANVAPLELLKREAVGGMGEVYLARDPLLRRTVAIKILRADLVADEAARERFLQEARIIASLDHPHIIAIHSVGELLDRSPYYVMDYVGGNLRDVIPDTGLQSPREAKRIVAAIASALDAAHSAGVLHLDVKPSNVLYDPVHREPKLSDWGIAAFRIRPAGRANAGWTAEVVAGSPGYMSPEQIEGVDIGPAADLYALGALGFQLLTGRRPFGGSTTPAILAAQLRSVPRSVASLRADVDAEFSELLGGCLSRRSEDRPTAEEVATRLRARQGGAIEWPPPGLDKLMGAGPPLGRRLVFWLGATAVMVASLMQRSGLARSDVSWHLATVVASLFGALLSVLILVRAVPLLHRIWRARLSGYDWLTLIDVVADPEGNSGAIIGGSGAFAGLRGSTRLRLVAIRRLLFVAALILALLLATILCVLALLGPVFSASQVAMAWAGGLGLLVAGATFDRATSARPRLLARRVYQTRSPALTAAWYRSLERLRLVGKRRIRTQSRLRTLVTISGVLSLMGTLSLLALPSLLVGLSGRFADALLVESLDQLSREVSDTQQLARWSGLALVPDSMYDGGPLLWSALSVAGQAGLDIGPGKPRVTAWRGLLAPWGRSDTPGAAESLRDSIFQLSSDGFSPEQVEWIESLIAQPALHDFRSASHASLFDLTSQMWSVSDSVDIALSGPSLGMPRGWELLIVAIELEAALLLHHGDPSAADMKLREPLTIAWHLSIVDPLWGRSAFREFGRRLDRIADLYEAQPGGSPLAAGIRSTLSQLGSETRDDVDRSDALVDASSLALEMLDSGHGSVAQRLHLARIAGLASRCGSIVEVSAGLTTQAAAAFDRVKPIIVGDHGVAGAVWMDWVEAEPSDRLARAVIERRGIEQSLASRLVPDAVARLTSLMGNPRIRGCRWVLPLAELYLRL